METLSTTSALASALRDPWLRRPPRRARRRRLRRRPRRLERRDRPPPGGRRPRDRRRRRRRRGLGRPRDGLPFTIRAGGHSVAGRSVRDGALCLDLRGLTRSRSTRRPRDRPRRRRRAAQRARRGDPGARPRRAGRPDLAHRRRRATLGGGVGWLMRAHGLTIDSLSRPPRSCSPTAQQVRASEAEHPDLFWALRGGGGDFGVVTRFEFQAHRSVRWCSAGCSPTRGRRRGRRSARPRADGGRARRS